jgi:hypothetical protein
LWSSKRAGHAKTAPSIGDSGKLQAKDNVVHFVVERMWRPTGILQPVDAGSRDFR